MPFVKKSADVLALTKIFKKVSKKMARKKYPPKKVILKKQFIIFKALLKCFRNSWNIIVVVCFLTVIYFQNTAMMLLNKIQTYNVL